MLHNQPVAAAGEERWEIHPLCSGWTMDLRLDFLMFSSLSMSLGRAGRDGDFYEMKNVILIIYLLNEDDSKHFIIFSKYETL